MQYYTLFPCVDLFVPMLKERFIPHVTESRWLFSRLLSFLLPIALDCRHERVVGPLISARKLTISQNVKLVL